MSWEVLTMQSKTSLFSPVLFRKNVTRFAPLWGILLGVLLLSGPVAIMRYSSIDRTSIWMASFCNGSTISYLLMNFGYAPLCAALVFRYLHQTRSAYMMHAFPINRSTQYVTNLLSGLCFAVVPFVVQTLLSQLTAVGFRGSEQLWQVLLVQLLSFLFFYGLAVFCMLISGNTVIAMLSYVALNFIFAALPLAILVLMRSLTFGVNFELHTDRLSYLSPIIQLVRSATFGESKTRIGFWYPLFGYAILGVVLIVLGWLHYRKRHIEQAGEAMAHRWARIAFLLVFTLSCTLGLGMILTMIFSLGENIMQAAFPVLVFFFVVASFIGWFAAEMMLKRTIKVFRKRQLLGWLCAALVTVLALCALRFDVLGVQHYVPKEEKLASATLELGTYNYNINENSVSDAVIELNDPRLLHELLELHRDSLAQFDLGATGNYGYGTTITVHYHLSGGRTVNRTFDVQSHLIQPLLEELNTPENAVAYYDKLLGDCSFDPSAYIHLEAFRIGRIYECREPAALKDAMLQDAAEGNLPILFSGLDLEYDYYLYCPNANIHIPKTATHTLELFGVFPR